MIHELVVLFEEVVEAAEGRARNSQLAWRFLRAFFGLMEKQSLTSRSDSPVNADKCISPAP